ncbi:MAG: aldehyde dehydrogenase family protein, partial [Candidatus Marinimicrobia bacterium]|nr:aldehyde dehydrogenase family protein [Candidatus Neomarinimicrobiota bacterium]
MNSIFEAQSKPQSNTTIKERLNHLCCIENWIKDHESDIVEAHFQDLGKPKSEVDLAEIWFVMSEIKMAKKNLQQWMSPKRKGISSLALFPAKAWVHMEPKGVVLIISPWNFPFNLTVGPMVSALAAGNRIMIKPSEMTPNVSALIEKMVADLFETNMVAVFKGDATVSTELLKLPFHHIFFTGSSHVGKIVMSAAAKHLASVTLELGGKSPTIIDNTAHIGMAVKKIAWGKCINAGQSCIAPDYILVHENVKDEFVFKLSQRLNEVFGESLEDKKLTKDYGRIVNSNHWLRINSLLENAIKEGASIAHGGGKNKAQYFFEPTLLDNVTLDMDIMTEEIFGPLLPIIPFKDLNECLKIIQ